MTSPDHSPAAAHVVVAGSGFAGLEVVLGLRAIVGSTARISLVSPDQVFAYRPAATLEAFSDTPPRAYDLAAIAADLGLRHHRTRIESVSTARKRIRLASGAQLTYDALVVATGTRATAGIPGALTFRDQRDVTGLRAVLRELEAGKLGSLVFAIPSGCSWPLPLYELALQSATRAIERGVETEITLVSPETRPLAALGAEASKLVAAELTARRVRFLGASTARGVCGGGALTVPHHAPVRADRVVAAPQLRGARITGIPTNRWGFVPTDAIGRIQGMVDVFAAGDMTTLPIKHGGLATQQSDRIAHTIAASLGLAAHSVRPGLVLELRLIGGRRPLYIRLELDEFSQPGGATRTHTRGDHGTASTKVFGRYLTPYLETRPTLS
jgi:sulfide:quinone oxidoreductase